MRQKMVMGNWKMNGQIDPITKLLNELQAGYSKNDAHCVVFPPFIYMALTQSILARSAIDWGAQNMHPNDCGAYTGEISAPMLKEFACNYVLIGHSERRQLFAEDENFIKEKFHRVKEHDMIPVLCVGETLAEREQGLTKEVLTRQLQSIGSLGKDAFKHCVVAYEPVWAIGTGVTATPEQAQTVHAFIRELVAEYDQADAQMLPILYGGSVNERNAKALFEMPDIDGGLVGGASLNAQQFLEIVKCIN